MLLLAHSVMEDVLLSLFKRRPMADGITSVLLDQRKFCLTRVVRDESGKPSLELCLFEECSSRAELERALTAAVRANGLQGAPCVCLLAPELYSLRQIDTPAVQLEEMREAARWSIKDLIDFPAEEAVIDIFDVPTSDTTRGKRIYVVATPASVIREVVDVVEASGLSLFAIDIGELALRNVAALLPEDQQGMALMYMSSEAGVLTITQRGSLFLARRLHSDLELLAESTEYEPGAAKPDQSEEAQHLTKSLLLETQRSLDYYEHQLEQGPVSALILVPLEIPLAGLRRYLATNLTVDVSVLDLNGVLRADHHLPQLLQARCMTAIGAALRTQCEAP